MNLFGMLGVSGSALTAERQRAEVVTANLANSDTTHTVEGGPYRRRLVVFEAQNGSRFPRLLHAGLRASPDMGVKVSDVVVDPAPPEMRYEPSSPDADAQGFVAYPNIEPVNEMVDLMGAVRAYDMNSTAVQATKQMIQQSIDLLR